MYLGSREGWLNGVVTVESYNSNPLSKLRLVIATRTSSGIGLGT